MGNEKIDMCNRERPIHRFVSLLLCPALFSDGTPVLKSTTGQSVNVLYLNGKAAGKKTLPDRYIWPRTKISCAAILFLPILLLGRE